MLFITNSQSTCWRRTNTQSTVTTCKQFYVKTEAVRVYARSHKMNWLKSYWFLASSGLSPPSSCDTSGPGYSCRPLGWSVDTSVHRQVHLSWVGDPAGAGRLRPLHSFHSTGPIQGVSQWAEKAMGASGCCKKGSWSVNNWQLFWGTSC